MIIWTLSCGILKKTNGGAEINIVNGTGIIPIYNNSNITTGTYQVHCYYFDGRDWGGNS